MSKALVAAALIAILMAGCSTQGPSASAMNLPANSEIASIDLLLVKHLPGEIPTSQPQPFTVKAKENVASILQPIRAAKSSPMCKCGRIAYLDLVRTNGKSIRLELLPGHGIGRYDINGPDGRYTIDAAEFDRALRDAGADELADALAPPTP